MTERMKREDGMPYLSPEQTEEGLSGFDRDVYKLSRGAALTHREVFTSKYTKSIPWDSEEYKVVPNDPRWKLPNDFDLGAHQWYQELPEERQIELGMYRYAQVARVGSEFEHALVAGVMGNNIWTSSESIKKLFTTQECEEELRHIQTFDQMIKRIGVDVKGAPEWFRYAGLGVGFVAKFAPVAFWQVVLAGEEPIDHTQQSLIKKARKLDRENNGTELLHPMLRHVMEYHVAEEARHISYADGFTRENVEKLSPRQRKIFKKGLPIALRIGANTMLRPTPAALEQMDVPEWVADDVWWNSEHGKKSLQALFEDTKQRAIDLDVMDEQMWQLCGLMDKDPASTKKPSIPSRIVGNLLRFSRVTA